MAGPRVGRQFLADGPCPVVQVVEGGAHRRQKGVSEQVDGELADEPRLLAVGQPFLHCGDRRPSVAGTDRPCQRHPYIRPGRNATGGRHQIEGRQGVAGRAAALGQHVVDRRLVDVEPGVGDDEPDVFRQLLGRKQVELEVLGPAANGGNHLVGLGGGQHEDHVLRGFLQRLQQRILGPGAEHVDLIEDVDLGSTG